MKNLFRGIKVWLKYLENYSYILLILFYFDYFLISDFVTLLFSRIIYFSLLGTWYYIFISYNNLLNYILLFLL